MAKRSDTVNVNPRESRNGPDLNVPYHDICNIMWYKFQMMTEWSVGWSDVKTTLRRSRKHSTCIIHWGQTYRNWWLAGIRKESGSKPPWIICKLFKFEKLSVLYLFSEFDLCSYPSPTYWQIQLFLCKLNLRYREHILTYLFPLLLNSVITANMNPCVIN